MSEQTQKRESVGAWKKQTSKGEVINFTIDGQRYSMWQNSNKKTEKHPDFNIVKDNYNPQQKVAVQADVNQAVAPQQPQYLQATPAPVSNDDLPF